MLGQPIGMYASLTTESLLSPTLNNICSWARLYCSSENIVYGGDNRVSSWGDNSGNSVTASSSGSARPSNQNNSLPSGGSSIFFDGNTQYLDLTSTSGTEKIIFVLANHKKSSASDTYMLGATSGNILFGYDSAGSGIRLYGSSSGYFSGPDYQTVARNQWKLYELTISSGGLANLFVNGVQDATTVSSGAVNISRIGAFAAGRSFLGNIAVVAIRESLSFGTNDRANIRQAIANWAGISL